MQEKQKSSEVALDLIQHNIYFVESSLLRGLQTNLSSEKANAIAGFLGQVKQVQNNIFLYSDILPYNTVNPINELINRANYELGSSQFTYENLDLNKIANWTQVLKDLNNSIEQNLTSYKTNKPVEFELKFSELSQNLSNQLDIASAKNQEMNLAISNTINLVSGIQHQANETFNKFQVESDNILKDLKNNAKANIEFQEKEAKENVEELQKLVKEGQKLSHYISGRALSGFFSDRADEEKASTAKWTNATWGFAAGTVFVIIAGLIYQLVNLDELAKNQDLQVALLGTKIILATTFGLIAKWTSKRANRHLSEESKYHRLAVNMKTIDSFIADLREDSKDEIMKTVALKTFTETNGNETATDYEAGGIDFLKSFLPKADK